MGQDLMEDARAETTQELTEALLKAASDTMRRHGDDPLSPVIAAAGFSYALDVIGGNDSSIPVTVVGMLKKLYGDVEIPREGEPG